MKRRKTLTVNGSKEYPLPPQKLWELLKETHLVNDATGQTQVSYEPYPEGAYSLYRAVKIRGWLGLFMGWEESPVEWIRHRLIRSRRSFASGPIDVLERTIEFQPTSHGTRVVLTLKVVIRSAWWTKLVHWHSRRWIQKVFDYCDRYFAIWIQRQRYERPRKKRSSFPLQWWRQRLGQFGSETEQGETLLAKLKQYVTEASDYELSEMRPKELAQIWNMKPSQVVRLLYYAAYEGLLKLKWVVVDPVSQLPLDSFESLTEVPLKVSSHESQVKVPVEWDQNLELRFGVNPEIREIKNLGRWENGPGSQPHVWVQLYLPPRSARTCQVEMGEEKFRLRTLRTNVSCELTPTSRPSQRVNTLKLTFQGNHWLTPRILFRPGVQNLEVVNESRTPVYFILERTRPDPCRLTAYEVFSHQEFSHLFSNEHPAKNVRWPVKRGTFLLASLKDSTNYFHTLGDHHAVNRIHHLLAFVATTVSASGGATLKIMGDTLMAQFSEPETAVRAAMLIQQRMIVFNQDHRINNPFQLKLSVHHGPGIAAYRSGKLDYFGETLNRLFQLNRLGTGGDIVLSQEVFELPHVVAVLGEYTFDHEFLTVKATKNQPGFSYVRLVDEILSENQACS